MKFTTFIILVLSLSVSAKKICCPSVRLAFQNAKHNALQLLALKTAEKVYAFTSAKEFDDPVVVFESYFIYYRSRVNSSLISVAYPWVISTDKNFFNQIYPESGVKSDSVGLYYSLDSYNYNELSAIRV